MFSCNVLNEKVIFSYGTRGSDDAVTVALG